MKNEFRQVGQLITFDLNGATEKAVIISYSNNFNGTMNFKTSKGSINSINVIKFY